MKHSCVKGRRGEGTKGRRDEGTKGRRDEGTKGRRGEGTKGRKKMICNKTAKGRQSKQVNKLAHNQLHK